MQHFILKIRVCSKKTKVKTLPKPTDRSDEDNLDNQKLTIITKTL